jgi:hypothetical protein
MSPATRKARRPATKRARKAVAAHVHEHNTFLACRTLRHSWDVIPIPVGGRVPDFGTLVCLRCVRCGTLRYDKFSRLTGERIANPSYVWPDGYRIQGGKRRSHAYWRAAWADTVSDRFLRDAEEE